MDYLNNDILNIIIPLSTNQNCFLVCKQWHRVFMSNAHKCATCHKITKIFDKEIWTTDEKDNQCHQFLGSYDDFLTSLDMINFIPKIVKKIKTPTSSICYKAITNNPENIQYIDAKYHTQDLWLHLLKNTHYPTNYIDKIPPHLKTYDFYYRLVKDNPVYIGRISHEFKTEELCLSVVEKDGGYLRYIPRDIQTEKICSIAVNSYPDMLEYVFVQTEEICLNAVKKNGMSIKYVKDQTYNVCIEAIKQNSSAIYHIENQTYEMCKLAVEIRGSSISYVKDKTDELCLIAIRQDFTNIKYIHYPSEYICLEAIKIDIRALSYIKNHTEKLCLEAIKINPEAVKYFNITYPSIQQKMPLTKQLLLNNIQDLPLNDCIQSFRKYKDVYTKK